MKLGEALALRADMHSRQNQLIKATEWNARYQDGEEPPEDAEALLTESLKLADDLAALCTRINLTNAATPLLADGTTSVTAALAKRDALRSKQKILNDALKAATGGEDRMYGYGRRATRTELVDKVALNVAALRTQQTEVTQELRELDNAIQQAGWATELI
jgi:hypothetical protein